MNTHDIETVLRSFLTGDGYIAADDIPVICATIEADRKRTADLLKNPIHVHVNMCRGIIAPITFDQLAHVLGDEATEAWLADRKRRGEPVSKIDPKPPQLSIVWHDSPESVDRAMWEQAAIEAGVTYEELIEGSNVGETEDGEVLEFTHEQAIDGMRTQGCWGFVDTKTNTINAWAADDVDAPTALHFLAHEIGHVTGEQLDDDMQEEMRAEQFGRVAALAYRLWCEKKNDASQPAEPDYKQLFEQMCERCDALDAKLAEYSEREPVGYIMPTALKQLKAGGNAIVGGVSQGCDVPIYIASQPDEPAVQSDAEVVETCRAMGANSFAEFFGKTALQPSGPVSKTDWNNELSSWSDEDFIRIFHERPDLANRLRKILAEPVAADFPAKGKLHGPLGWIANNTNPEPVHETARAAGNGAEGGMPAEPMKSYLTVKYDEKGDCLYVYCDSNEPADAEEDDKGILYRRAISDGRLVGITIMNFMGRHAESSDDVPQPAEPGSYVHTAPDDCETLHWRGQILSLNELATISAEPVNVPLDKAGAVGRAFSLVRRLKDGEPVEDELRQVIRQIAAEPVKAPSDEEVLKIAIDSGLAFRDSTGEVLCAWREDADISEYLVENARALLARYSHLTATTHKSSNQNQIKG